MSKEIRDKFLENQDKYFNLSGDMYVASQMAANATSSDYNLTKEQLIEELKK